MADRMQHGARPTGGVGLANLGTTYPRTVALAASGTVPPATTVSARCRLSHAVSGWALYGTSVRPTTSHPPPPHHRTSDPQVQSVKGTLVVENDKGKGGRKRQRRPSVRPKHERR